jgi:hypothetical protein
MHSLHRENHLIERIGWLRAAVLGANDGAGDYQGDLFGNDCEGMCGGLRRKHLQSYLDEFVFRFNRRAKPHAAFRTLLGIGIAIKPEAQG